MIKTIRKLLIFLFLLAVISGFGQTEHQKTYSSKIYHILFIGNSLTYMNNLPGLVKEKARFNGIRIKTKMVAFPDYALIDHWNEGKIQKLIKKRKYDFVIVQQGPSSQNSGRQFLLEYASKINELCLVNDSKLVLFMVWPSLDYFHTFSNVIKNYRDAAVQNNAILCPVGEVWKAHFDKTNNFDYYSFDGFHPSQIGSRATAAIIVEHLFR